eukprot:5343001-Amphidinium_carterae.1
MQGRPHQEHLSHEWAAPRRGNNHRNASQWTLEPAADCLEWDNVSCWQVDECLASYVVFDPQTKQSSAGGRRGNKKNIVAASKHGPSSLSSPPSSSSYYILIISYHIIGSLTKTAM